MEVGIILDNRCDRSTLLIGYPALCGCFSEDILELGSTEAERLCILPQRLAVRIIKILGGPWKRVIGIGIALGMGGPVHFVRAGADGGVNIQIGADIGRLERILIGESYLLQVAFAERRTGGAEIRKILFKCRIIQLSQSDAVFHKAEIVFIRANRCRVVLSVGFHRASDILVGDPAVVEKIVKRLSAQIEDVGIVGVTHLEKQFARCVRTEPRRRLTVEAGERTHFAVYPEIKEIPVVLEIRPYLGLGYEHRYHSHKGHENDACDNIGIVEEGIVLDVVCGELSVNDEGEIDGHHQHHIKVTYGQRTLSVDNEREQHCKHQT